LRRRATSSASRWASKQSTICWPTSRPRSSGRRPEPEPRPPGSPLDALHPIDLRFGGFDRAIGVYLLDSPSGPLLFDCGPSSTLPRLEEGLREAGVELGDIRHLLLSHIHLDHAGAVGAIVREHPGLTVWVSEIGAPHLVDPSRLERSARRLYGEAFDELWGELAPVPEKNIRIATGDVLGWEVFPAPGHASHHVAYFRDGTLLAGDTCGIRIQPSRRILPVAPPPDIDIEAWHATIAEIERRSPDRLALIHFGVETDVTDHLTRLGEELDRWAAWVRDGMTLDEFVASGRAEAGDEADLSDRVAPYWQSWYGLRRYWVKRGVLQDQ
jgi:glyoxylase-like metal-dependent hydrolase (beta-lactamase superfamily II)